MNPSDEFFSNQPLEDSYHKQKLEPDEEINIPQDDLFTLTWETDFGTQLPKRDDEANPSTDAVCDATVASNDEPNVPPSVEVR